MLQYAILHLKNAMFCKTQRSAYGGHLFMSLIHTCLKAVVNRLEYLTWLLKNTRDLEYAPDSFLHWNYRP